MEINFIVIFSSIGNCERIIIARGDDAGIAYLTARHCIKDRFVENDCSLLACAEHINKLAVIINDRLYNSVTCEIGVAEELCCIGLDFY